MDSRSRDAIHAALDEHPFKYRGHLYIARINQITHSTTAPVVSVALAFSDASHSAVASAEIDLQRADDVQYVRRQARLSLRFGIDGERGLCR